MGVSLSLVRIELIICKFYIGDFIYCLGYISQQIRKCVKGKLEKHASGWNPIRAHI